MDSLPFLLALLHVHKALSGETLWDTTVKLTEKLTLECAYSPTELLTQVEWLKDSGQTKEHIATFNPSLGLGIMKPYTNRVFIRNSTEAPNVITLNFNNASEADTGFYTCRLNTFPRGSMEKVIQVVKTDHFESIALLNETISDLDSETGQNITLTYQFRTKGPVKKVTWKKIQPHQVDVLTSCNLLEERTSASKYYKQVWATCRQRSRVSLLFIPSISVAESAIYCCLVEASTGDQETYVVRLTVHDPESEANYQHNVLVAGGIVGSAAVLIIIICVISYFTRRKSTNFPFKDSSATENKKAKTCRSQATDEPDDIYVNYPTISKTTKSKV
ncbi:CD226 antigen isoform 2-T4 [Thomomys bottae]